MLRTVNLVSRVLGFAWVGVLAFVLAPPHGAFNLPVQIAGYCLAGAALLAWALVDNHPAAARYRGRGLPVTFGAMAVAGSGVAKTFTPEFVSDQATLAQGSSYGRTQQAANMQVPGLMVA